MAEPSRRLPIPGLSSEVGRDGTSALVDQDRALRTREIMASPTPERRAVGKSLRERIEGRPPGALAPEAEPAD